MNLAELLMEKCHLEQEIARKQAEELRKRNSILNPEAVEAPEGAQEAAPSVKNELRVNILKEGKHIKHKRSVSNYGYYTYTPYETKLQELEIEFKSHYYGAFAKIVHDGTKVIKVVVSGPLASKFRESIKNLAERWFLQQYKA